MPLRYGRYLACHRFTTAGGASWNGAGVERAGATRRREDLALASCFVFRPKKPMGTEVARVCAGGEGADGDGSGKWEWGGGGDRTSG